MNSLGKGTDIQLSQILVKRDENDNRFRRTKIVCTMGPSSRTVETVVKLIDAGMNVARLNFSHGDHTSHGDTVKVIAEALKQRPGCSIGLLLDTKGPEIRTGMLKGGKAISVKAGQTLRIVTDYKFLGDETCIACSYPKLPMSVKEGNTILMADGSLSCQVKTIGPDFVDVTILNNATIGERKNMNLPNVKVDLPCTGEKEKNDILKFGLPQGCNFVAASFVQCADDVHEIRELLTSAGSKIKIISKIENVEGIVNFDKILEASDGIMVARGDMGMEIPPEKVFLAQKMMISKCNVAGKPVITATQMLESMTHSLRPTRAEVADVANAVLDGTDCVMLSGETANGEFPVETVAVMARVCLEAEGCINYPCLFRAIWNAIPRPVSVQEAVCCAAVETAEDVQAGLILAFTETGQNARLIAKYRPAQTIWAISSSCLTVQQLSVFRGVRCMLVPSLRGTDTIIQYCLKNLKESRYVNSGESVVVVHGFQEEFPGGTDTMKVIEVP